MHASLCSILALRAGVRRVVARGGRQTSDSFDASVQVCAYALTDILAKAVLGFMVMSSHDVLGAASGSASREYV